MATRGRQSWLRMPDVKRAIDADLKFILYWGFHAGLRKAEICAVRVGWFDFHNPEEPVFHVQNDPDVGFFLKDRDNRPVEISRGTINESLAHAREIFRPVIAQSAYVFVLVHNKCGAPHLYYVDLIVM
jgi:integrase